MTGVSGQTAVIPALYAKEGELFIELKAPLGKTLTLPQGETDSRNRTKSRLDKATDRHYLLNIPHTNVLN